jgi:hypothetical protein
MLDVGWNARVPTSGSADTAAGTSTAPPRTCSATNLLGRPERARRGGYPSQAAARRARDEWLAATGEDRTARSWTVERWLRYWLASRTSIRPTTKLHYTRDVERVLIPHLGRLCLADLDSSRSGKTSVANGGVPPTWHAQATSSTAVRPSTP